MMCSLLYRLGNWRCGCLPKLHTAIKWQSWGENPLLPSPASLGTQRYKESTGARLSSPIALSEVPPLASLLSSQSTPISCTISLVLALIPERPPQNLLGSGQPEGSMASCVA